MSKINIRCDECNKVHSVQRTSEIPPEVKSLSCNWCVECEDNATDYYKEEQHLIEDFNDINPNQLTLL